MRVWSLEIISAGSNPLPLRKPLEPADYQMIDWHGCIKSVFGTSAASGKRQKEALPVILRTRRNLLQLACCRQRIGTAGPTCWTDHLAGRKFSRCPPGSILFPQAARPEKRQDK